MTRLAALLGTWSRPPDLVAKLALGVSVVLAIMAIRPPPLQDRERRPFLAIVGLVAALVSVVYIATYLRGGPRIVDATTYFLQGRALAHGDLSWTPLEPSASFRGRFLAFRAEGPDAPSLGGIFPPGYPLLLAFGFVLGAPMIVGPLLAGALVVATYQLTRTLAEQTLPASLSEPTARASALLSVVCAALRYHTADTMSHAASALGITVALTLALRSRARWTDDPRDETASPFDGGRADAIGAGLAVGYVFATRPVSALPIAIIVAALLWRKGHPVVAAVATLPGLFLLVLSQRAVAGEWFGSTQRLYYAMSDGPTGCFRWGFGKGTGCIHEHGEFVEARLGAGYGVIEAIGTTARRLHKHVLDVANFEPLALLVLVPVFVRRRLRSAAPVIAATALVGLQMLAYVPFYFDGDYPGGGARFFADVLPVEHALVMLGVAAVARAFTRAAFAILALATAGFAIHASYEHLQLRDREGGCPMFDPDVLARASITSGLVFVDTDHGFALGHDPSAKPANAIVVARLRGDDRDRMLYDALGHPPTYRYTHDLEGKQPPNVIPWAPPEPGSVFRFEAEAEWPPLAQANGFAAPTWTNGCASGGRALVLTPDTANTPATATVTLPVPREAEWAVEVHVVHRVHVPHAAADAGMAEGTITIGSEQWSWTTGTDCAVLPAKAIKLAPPFARVTIQARGGAVGVDYVSLYAR